MKTVGNLFDFITFWIITGITIINAFVFRSNFHYGKERFEKIFANPDPVQSNKLEITTKDLACAAFAQLAYEGDLTREKIIKKWGYRPESIKHFIYNSEHTNFEAFRSGGVFQTSAYVFRVTNSAVVVCFRGTQPFQLTQWFTDLSVIQHAYPSQIWHPRESNIRVHRGFVSALGLNVNYDCSKTNTMFRLLVEHINLLEGVEAVYITGHSLGAALAQQFAFGLKNIPDDFLHPRLLEVATKEVGKKVAGVYTFGTPNSGNQEFATQFNKSYKNIVVHRVVNNDDIVCRVPFDAINVRSTTNLTEFRYKATKGLIYLTIPTRSTNPSAGTALTVSPGIGLDRKKADSSLGITFGWSSLLDHMMNSYHDRLTLVHQQDQKPKTQWKRMWDRFQPY